MYSRIKPIENCQCCMRGVAIPNLEGSSDLLGNNDTPKVVHSSDNASCFHISFSFSAAHKAPLCKGGWQKSLISDWGIVLCRYATIPPSRLRRATSLCTREAFRPTIILQITLLVSANKGQLYRKIYFFNLL